MALKSCRKIETNTYQLEVTVESELFVDACKKAYMKERKSIQIPGFRKGKATQGMIEKVYGESAFYEDALDIVYPDIVQAAIDESGLRVVCQPFDLEVPVISKSEGVEMVLKVTTYPEEVKLGEYKGLKYAKIDSDATDEDVDNEIAQMQERNGRLVVIEDEKAQSGDTAEIDFEGFVDGESFEGGKGENFPLELGSNSFIPGFEDQVAGHMVGEEFDVNVIFPEDYVEDLAGKEAVFKCKIHEIKRKELPELDDEFAKDVSEFDTLDELKADLKKQIAEKKAENAKIDMENQLIEQIVDGMEAEIPECMNENKCDEMIQEYSYRLQAQGIELEMYLQYLGQTIDQFKESFMDSAKQQVKTAVAIEAIVNAEKLEATQEEIDEKVKELAEQYSMDEEQIKKVVSQDQFVKDITFKKAIDLVVENAVASEE